MTNSTLNTLHQWMGFLWLQFNWLIWALAVVFILVVVWFLWGFWSGLKPLQTQTNTKPWWDEKLTDFIFDKGHHSNPTKKKSKPSFLKGVAFLIHPFWLLVAILAILAFALARPVLEKNDAPVFETQKSPIVVLFDVSQSMMADDLKPNRLERARLKLNDLISLSLDGDYWLELGLIAFAQDAFVVSPLSDDVSTLKSFVDSLEPTIMPRQGSQVSSAIAQGVALLDQAGAEQGTLLLITDGVENQALSFANDFLDPHKLNVLGVGTLGGAPVPQVEGGFIHNSSGQMVVERLDISKLQDLARIGGGIYRTAENSVNDLIDLLDASIHDEKVGESDMSEGDLYYDQGPWLVLGALLIASFLFRQTHLMVLPFFLLSLTTLPVAPVKAQNTPDIQAYDWHILDRDYQAKALFDEQKFRQAAQLFEDKRWKAQSYYKAQEFEKSKATYEMIVASDDFIHLAKDDEFWYNFANATAQSGDLALAIAYYDQALGLNPEHQNASINRQKVLDALQNQSQQNSSQSNPSSQQEQGEENSQSSQPSSSEGNDGSDDSGGNNGSGNTQQNGQTQAGQSNSQNSQNSDSGNDESGESGQKEGGDTSVQQNTQKTGESGEGNESNEEGGENSGGDFSNSNADNLGESNNPRSKNGNERNSQEEGQALNSENNQNSSSQDGESASGGSEIQDETDNQALPEANAEVSQAIQDQIEALKGELQQQLEQLEQDNVAQTAQTSSQDGSNSSNSSNSSNEQNEQNVRDLPSQDNQDINETINSNLQLLENKKLENLNRFRGVEDDPKEFLRRKFYQQHRLKQQQNSTPLLPTNPW